MTRILQTDLARDALYTKVNQIADEKVSLEDDETITGKKTFTQNIVRANTNLTKGTNPSSTSYCSVELTDKNGSGTTHRAGLLEATVYTTGETMTSINAYKWQANANYSARIAIYYPTSGNPYTEAPTPTDTTTTNGTQIATTGWVNSGSNNVVHKSGNETIAGTKTFSSTISGSVNGNAATVTNGVYTTGNQTIGGTKTFSSTISGSINGNAATVTNGVYTTGDQTIGGTKTFSSALSVKNTLPTFKLANSKVTKGTNPSSGSDYQWRFNFTDSSNNDLGRIWQMVNSNGDTWIELKSYPNTSSTSGEAGVSIRRFNDGTRSFHPTTASIVSLGRSGARWKEIYADTSTISTSDERLKQNIEELPDEVLEAWGEVGFYRFKFKSSVSEKGLENARYHTGVVAQRIKSIFESHNLDASKYGLFCYDEWGYEPEEKDEDGDIISPERPAGSEYSIRYEECLCMEAAYQRWRANKLEERIKNLEDLLTTK